MTTATRARRQPLEPLDKTGTWAVIGAGSSGLTAAKNLRQHGFDVIVFEREDEVGGNWNYLKPHSRVYASTHTISSKPFTQYADFPMPDDWPDYPHHSHLLEYFKRYAEHFGLNEVIAFSTSVDSVTPVDGGAAWDVTTTGPAGTSTARYAGVVIANGHNWNPKTPDYEGLSTFTGEVLHSADYKSSEQLRGKKVLVVGAGNTGCDVAVESAQVAAHTWHSTRRGYWYAPKYTFGKPSDQVNDLFAGLLRFPLAVRRMMYKSTLRMTVGDLVRHGLPKPDHEFYETHPVVNSQLVYYVGHGDITPAKDIARIDGPTVTLVDGTMIEPDVVVFCTGYLVRFDFVDEAHLDWRDGRPHLYQHVFSPTHDNLFVAGLIQPDSGQFTLAHWQAVAIATYLEARRDRPGQARAFRDRVRAQRDRVFSDGAHYKESTRHYFEVAHLDYLRSLEQTIKSLGGVA